MADDHRRVEPRPTIGAGMAADPERIDGLRKDWERAERTWRSAPDKKFSTIMAEESTPEDALPPRLQAGQDAADNPNEDHAEKDEDEERSADDDAELNARAPLPRVQPDSRMRSLHARFDKHERPESSAPGETREEALEKPAEKDGQGSARPGRKASSRTPVRKKSSKRIRG